MERNRGVQAIIAHHHKLNEKNMAKLEDLIKQISETRLRDQIADEVDHLKTGKKFGLVFEEYIPEL